MDQSSVSSPAQNPPAQNPPAQNPQVSAELASSGRVVAAPVVSPDGTRVLFTVIDRGKTYLCVVPSVGGAELRLTATVQPSWVHASGGATAGWDGPDRVLFLGADGCLWSCAAVGGNEVLVSRPPTGTQFASFALSRSRKAIAAVMGDAASQVVVQIDRTDAGTWNDPQPVGGEEADFVVDPDISDNYVAWHQWSVPDMPWDGGELVTVSAGSTNNESAPVLVDRGCSVGQARFSPCGSKLAFVSDRSGWKNLTLLDLATGSTSTVTEPYEHAGPTWGQGARTSAWSPDGSHLAFARNEGGFGRLCVVAVGSDGLGAVREVAKGVHFALSWEQVEGSPDSVLVGMRTGGKTPTQVVAYPVPAAAAHDPHVWDSVSDHRRTLAYCYPGGYPSGALSEPHLTEWLSTQIEPIGSVVHGRLYRPSESPRSGDLPPLLVHLHGGPTDQTTVSFNPRFAFWLARGWAVFVPDYRGSTGWGRDYASALHRRWGLLDVDDVAAGIAHCIEQRWCDPERVVVIGGSAGGFTALSVLAAHPGLCAAGVSLYGVSDLLGLAETTHRFEGHYLDTLVGPLPDATPEYERRSPVQFASRITDPLLVLHGTDDPVVPIGQSRALVEAVQRAGGSVEFHAYEGERHGWSRPETMLDELVRTESFLDRVVPRATGTS